MDCIIIEIVVDYAFSDSEVFIWVFNNWFLEETVEAKYLSVVLEPFWGNSWNRVVYMIFTRGDVLR